MDPSEFIRLIYPRTVVVVTSTDKKGIANAAPYSWICPISFSPAMLMVGIQDRETRTMGNIRETGEFVVNVVTRDWAKKAIECEAKIKEGESKLEKTGLETVQGKKVKVPAIKKAKIVLECALSEIMKPKDADHLIVVGEIVHAETKNPKLEEIVMHLLGEKFCTPGREFVQGRKK
ncbi:MAG: flavin reductase family protein [Candidatus ainarchaeum sp.]|nr:flavin reductase family protein [Candidatus ainarchaeum sp.]